MGGSEELEGLERVRALLREWDPIGVIDPGTPQAWDEYDSYAPFVLAMVAKGCTPERLSSYLADCRTRRMGLPSDPASDLASATKIVEWWKTKLGPELPDWTFSLEEVSAGVYQVTALDGVGHRVQATGVNPDVLLLECRRDVAQMVARGLHRR